MEKEIIWKDRKRTILFGLPLSFTVYELINEKLLINTGFLSTKQEEIMLYRMTDFTLKRSLIQRLFGLGTIHICSSDKTTPEFDIINIKKPETIKEILSRESINQKIKKRSISREVIVDSYDEDSHI